MLVLLTGASGFIGNAFLHKVLSGSLRIRILSRRPFGRPLSTNIEYVVDDYCTSNNLDKIMHGVDVVVHAAAEINDHSKIFDVNYYGSMRLLTAAINAGVKRWVQVSSVGVYGRCRNQLVTESTPESPVGIYEKSKALFDTLLFQLAVNSDLEYTIIRPSIVYGRHMPNSSLRMILKALRLGLFFFIGPPGSSANYVHIDDVVDALMLSVSLPKAANQTYIVSCHSSVEVMVSSLARGAGMNPPFIRLNLAIARFASFILIHLPFRILTPSRVDALTSRVIYSSNKIQNDLGWKPSVSIQQGMYDYGLDQRS
mgnify:CR=1 FL=1